MELASDGAINLYYFQRNLQGNVVAILDTDGTPMVEYTYDAWGNLLSVTGSLTNTLGADNPLRYRGYVYDTQTRLYYLQSRYYDPEVGRFLNADALVSTGQGLLGNNMFDRCNAPLKEGGIPMKKLRILFAAICVAILFSGCDVPFRNPVQHTFAYEREDVMEIEICSNNELDILKEGSKMESLPVLAVLPDEEIDLLWKELLEVPAYELRYVAHGCGDLLFVISYANGTKELIGFYDIGIVNADGTFGGYRSHALGDGALLAQLFARYADPEILAKASMTFRAYYVTEGTSS